MAEVIFQFQGIGSVSDSHQPREYIWLWIRAASREEATKQAQAIAHHHYPLGFQTRRGGSDSSVRDLTDEEIAAALRDAQQRGHSLLTEPIP